MARIARSDDEVPRPPTGGVNWSTLGWFLFALFVAGAMIFGFLTAEAPPLR
jgi:hypothetical protein